MDTKQPYPVHIEGELDANVSRWLWLVKWLLAIPHYIVLAFLWLTLLVLTVVAFFAILITGRYPRGMFDFNVGAALVVARGLLLVRSMGTDRYRRSRSTKCPTTRHGSMSRIRNGCREGSLVKSWLLAIPHLVIVGIFLGGGSFATAQVDEGAWSAGFHVGLIGVSCSSPASRSLHRALPDGDLRFRARARSVGGPCGGLRAAHAGRGVSAVPSRPGWSRSWGRRRRASTTVTAEPAPTPEARGGRTGGESC